MRSIVLSLTTEVYNRNTVEWGYFKRKSGISFSRMKNLAIFRYGPIHSMKDVYVIDITLLRKDKEKVFRKFPWMKKEIKHQLEILLSQ